MQARHIFPGRRVLLVAILLVLTGLVLGVLELRARRSVETILRQTCLEIGVIYEDGDTVAAIIARAFPLGTPLERFFATVAQVPGLAISDLGSYEGCQEGVMIWLQVSYEQMGFPSDPLGLTSGHAERYLCFEDGRLTEAWRSDPSYVY